jgi:hypothetical protein
MISMLLTFLFTCLAFFGLGGFGFSVHGSCFLPERLSNHCQGLRRACSEICTKFVPFRVHCEIASGQIHDYKYKDVKISTSTQMRDILNTVSQDKLVLSSAVACHYYNCCTAGSTSPGNYGNPPPVRAYGIGPKHPYAPMRKVSHIVRSVGMN